MYQYTIRNATFEDIPFLADVIIEAEKSNSDKLSFSTLFNLEVKKVKEFIVDMLNEEIDGCEISLSSFLIVEFDDNPIAAFGGWIEGFEDEMSSKLLKSNLISYTFGKDSILFLKSKSHLIKDILIDRENRSLQLEYLFVAKAHRGKKITKMLIDQHVMNAKNDFPNLKKVQVQVFKNNEGAIKAYQNNGFLIVKSFKVSNLDVLNYLPFNEKYLMEKILN
jgi:ribosomal protein S18 acetylase RimI-like enzyme